MMSTRSGKRIHSSISENVDSVSEIEIQIEKKTRSKRAKENSDEVSTNKKKNFIRRPSDDEVEGSNDKTENTSKSGRNSRRLTLRELNVPAVDYEELNDRKSMRQHRRSRKENTVELTNVCVPGTNEMGKENKKHKKKRAVVENFENEPVEAGITTKKKTNKKKRQSNCFTVEELVTGEHNKSFNKSNVSIDSFHSAAGSPDIIKDDHFKNAEIGKNRGRKESRSLKFNNYVENVKDSKKRGKKTAKGKYFGTSINKSGKLSASNESLDSSVNKKEEIEDKDVNRFEKEVSNTLRTKLKQTSYKERNFLSNIENTHTKAVFHNSIEANIHGTDLKKKTIDTKYYIDTSTSNFDFINIPHIKGKGLESVSPLNNSTKKSRKSTSKNSTSNKIAGSITLLNDCNKDTVDNLMIVYETQLDDININHITGAEEPRKIISKDTIYEKINLSDRKLDQTFDKTENSFYKNSNADEELSHYNRRSSRRESSIKNTTYDKIEDNLVDITFNKEPSNTCNTDANSTANKSRISLPQDIVSTVLNGTYEKITKDESSSFYNDTYDKPILDTTFERTEDNIDGDNIINLNPKSSIISSDNTDNLTSDRFEDCSRASITSDDSRSENIVNTTPLLIESSMDESQLNSASILLYKTATPQNEMPIGNIFTSDKQENSSDNNKTPLKREGTLTETKTTPFKRDGTYIELRTIPAKHRPTLNPTTPLKREGTFTKESTEVMSPNHKSVDKTPPTRRKSTPSPGRTPFSTFRGGSKGRITLNVTHSIEKPQRLSSVILAPRRPTRVMFRSPVDNPGAVVAQTKGKVIKSNLKGSMKSFMFDESASEQCGSRKRSRTQDCAEDGAKRARTAASGAGRTRTASAAARLQASVVAEATPPVSKSEPKPRTKLPDFAALHRKQFSKMESLDECQRRHARRARALLTPPPLITPTALNTPTTLLAPTASLTPMAPRERLHRNNPKETSDTAQSQSATRLVTQKSKEIDKKNQSYTRFGFKLNLDVNPFSVPAKTAANLPKDVIKPKVLRRQATLPSLAGTTHRKEAAKQAVMREKSFTDKRDVNRNQNRTVIKGVRTNRRFELQMKMRNID